MYFERCKRVLGRCMHLCVVACAVARKGPEDGGAAPAKMEQAYWDPRTREHNYYMFLHTICLSSGRSGPRGREPSHIDSKTTYIQSGREPLRAH